MADSAMRESPTLLSAARLIFGDLITAAFVVTWDHNSPPAKVEQRLDEADAYPHISEDGRLDFNGCEIVLRFNTGHIVVFGSSEWGRMHRLSEAELTQALRPAKEVA